VRLCVHVVGGTRLSQHNRSVPRFSFPLQLLTA
jgi:hypothetical protein